LYIERKKLLTGEIYDNSKGKDGKHRIKSSLTKLKDLEWLGFNLLNDAIRTSLKRYLNFDYEDESRFQTHFVNV